MLAHSFGNDVYHIFYIDFLFQFSGVGIDLSVVSVPDEFFRYLLFTIEYCWSK